MGSKTALPCSTFWTSAETRKFITNAAQGNWEIPPNVEPWQSMLNVMVENNNPDQSVLCSYCLYMFVDLIQKYGSSLKKRCGPGWSELPVQEMRDDRLSRKLLTFLKEIMAVDRNRAWAALLKLASEGLRYKMPGGRAGKYRSKDFGIKLLIALTAKIEAISASQRKNANQESKVSNTEDRGRLKLVILDLSRELRSAVHV